MKIKMITFANAVKVGNVQIDFAQEAKYDIVIQDSFLVRITEKVAPGREPPTAYTTLFNVKWWHAEADQEALLQAQLERAEEAAARQVKAAAAAAEQAKLAQEASQPDAAFEAEERQRERAELDRRQREHDQKFNRNAKAPAPPVRAARKPETE